MSPMPLPLPSAVAPGDERPPRPTIPPPGRSSCCATPAASGPCARAVGDGVVAGSGRVAGRQVYCWAQDGTHRGGSLGTAGGETIARTIRMAAAAGAPVVGFPHSGGARLQEGVAALTAYAAIFRAQVLAPVPQIAVICGPCAGGAAYSPALGDITVMAGPEARMFLTGPAIVERVTRQRVSAEELGRAARARAQRRRAPPRRRRRRPPPTWCATCSAHLPSAERGALPLAPPAEPRPGDPGAVVPAEHRKVYDVRDVVARIVDGGRLLELAPRWARNMVVGFARLDGLPGGRHRQPAPPPGRHASTPRARRRAPGSCGCATASACRWSCSSTPPGSCPEPTRSARGSSAAAPTWWPHLQAQPSRALR